MKPNGIHDRPVWTTLDVLANSFLKDDNPRDRTAIGTLLEMAGIRREDIGSMLDFLETYGKIAYMRAAFLCFERSSTALPPSASMSITAMK